MTITRTYSNGGCNVIMKPDGTKIRFGENPTLPESIDFKITDYCDAGCKFCHETSTIHGRHGKKEFFFNVVSQMIRGTELAIGGGNPLAHPYLLDYLKYCKASGIYANLTINHEHVDSEQLKRFVDRNLVAGIGVSLPKQIWDIPDQVYRLYCKHPSRTVFHIIAGIHKPEYIADLKEEFDNPKILLLGYKEFGFGSNYLPTDIDSFLCGWKNLKRDQRLFEEISNTHLSFDNLAVKQLGVKELWPEKFDKHYMGGDGQYTMYIDGVTQRYAIGSTCKRLKVNGQSLESMFSEVKKASIESANPTAAAGTSQL